MNQYIALNEYCLDCIDYEVPNDYNAAIEVIDVISKSYFDGIYENDSLDELMKQIKAIVEDHYDIDECEGAEFFVYSPDWDGFKRLRIYCERVLKVEF